MKIFASKISHILSTVIFSIMLVMLSCIYSFSTLQASETFVVSSPSLKMFFIYSTKSQLGSSAKSLAEYQMARNGAGYIWKNENYYYVISSAYENKNDAELVSAKLKSDGEENEIFEISLKSINFICPISSPEAKSTLGAGLNLFVSTYRSLFDISVCLDTKIYDETNAFLEINRTYAKADEVMKNFHIVFGECEEKQIKSLENAILDLNESIGFLAENQKINEKQTLISQIRYHYVQIIEIFNSFLTNF